MGSDTELAFRKQEAVQWLCGGGGCWHVIQRCVPRRGAHGGRREGGVDAGMKAFVCLFNNLLN